MVVVQNHFSARENHTHFLLRNLLPSIQERYTKLLKQSNKYYDNVDLSVQVTIRAVATSRDGSKHSSVVTKTFTVREAVETSGESDNETVCMSLHLVC